MSILNESMLFTGISGLSYAVGLFCSDRVQRIYKPILEITGQYKNQNDFVIPLRQWVATVLGPKIPSTMDHFYVNMARIDKVIRISERIGIQSALFVGFAATAGSFFRTWKEKESRPLVVNIMEGAMLGSALGCFPVICGRNMESRGVQWITGIGIGFFSGMIAATLGTISGYVAKEFFDKEPSK